jgi:hypothetical protein
LSHKPGHRQLRSQWTAADSRPLATRTKELIMLKLIIATGLISLLAACGSMSGTSTSSSSMSGSNTATMGAGWGPDGQGAAGGPTGPTRFGPN